jgi:hypothetical protein
MTDGFRTHQTTQQPGNGTSPADRLEFGKRANTGLRLVILAGLFAMSLVACVLLESTLGLIFGAIMLGAGALATVFGYETRWTCSGDKIIIESTSLVTEKSQTIGRADIASLKIQTNKDPDGPNTYDVELLTEAGSVYKLNHRTRDAADKTLTALSASLNFTSKYTTPP